VANSNVDKFQRSKTLKEEFGDSNRTPSNAIEIQGVREFSKALKSNLKMNCRNKKNSSFFKNLINYK